MSHHRPIACDSWCPAGWADVHGGQVVEKLWIADSARATIEVGAPFDVRRTSASES